VTIANLRAKYYMKEEEEEDDDVACKTSLARKWSNQLTMKNKMPNNNCTNIFYSVVRLHAFMQVFFV
jgi:hypothetical protein